MRGNWEMTRVVTNRIDKPGKLTPLKKSEKRSEKGPSLNDTMCLERRSLLQEGPVGGGRSLELKKN